MVELVLPIPQDYQEKWDKILSKPKNLYPIKAVSWINKKENRKINVGELVKATPDSVTVKITNNVFLRESVGYLIEFSEALLFGVQGSPPMPDYEEFIMHNKGKYLKKHEYDALEILVKLRKI